MCSEEQIYLSDICFKIVSSVKPNNNNNEKIVVPRRCQVLSFGMIKFKNVLYKAYYLCQGIFGFFRTFDSADTKT